MAWVNLKNYWKYSNFCKYFFKYNILVMDYAGSCNEHAVFVLLVEINTWQLLKCTYLLLIQCSWLVEIYAWHGYFGWACTNKACQFQLQGNPCLITKLWSFWSTKCHLCGACESRVNFTVYFLSCTLWYLFFSPFRWFKKQQINGVWPHL